VKVALIHYWLVGMRGGEKVLESLCRLFPSADIFTHVADPAQMSATISAHRIVETSIARLPFARRKYQMYLPFMPGALEALDLSGYDLVISSESGPAKGVIAPPDAFHLCYTHSPMRYLWDQYNLYRDGSGHLTRTMMPLLAPRLRQWDVSSAARVDSFLANSSYVAKRIQKYWRRDAEVLAPPVDVDAFTPLARGQAEDFYLWVGELVHYKRPDIAVEAFTRMGRKLVVIGGPESERRILEQKAGPNVVFLGKTDFATLRDHMARCRALIFPGEEDFGIVPVEVMASGRPVIAYGRGGALDTVVDGETGMLFQDQSTEGLIEAVESFEAQRLWDLDPLALATHARRFDETNFQDGIRAALARGGVTMPAAPTRAARIL
jgi:glycosyltransferase involved in cell wall biosynthesis